MSLAQYLPNLPVLIYKTEWSTPAVAKAAIEAAYGIDFGTTHTFHISLWEGQADPDDYATVLVTAGTLTFFAAFNTTPEDGTPIYVLDIYYS